MGVERRLLGLGITPRLICREAAAEYCGISPNQFDTHVTVDPVMLGKRKLYDIRSLNRWLDQQSGFTQPLVSNDKWLEALDGDQGEGR